MIIILHMQILLKILKLNILLLLLLYILIDMVIICHL